MTTTTRSHKHWTDKGGHVTGAAEGDGMNAPNKGAMALETRTEAGQLSLEAVHSSRRAPFNLIDAMLLADTNRAKALASLAFSAAS